MSLNIVGLIQARLSSQRLPRKMFADVEGRTVIERVIQRAGAMKSLTKLAVIVPRNEKEWPDAISVPSRYAGVNMLARVYNGHPTDVLSRYYWTAKLLKADITLRLTGDCPCWDPLEGEKVLDRFLEGDIQYCSNLGESSDGTDTEIFSMDALAEAWLHAQDPYEREHVTPWMRRTALKREHVDVPGPAVKLSVDTEEDLERVRRVYRVLKRELFTWEEAVRAAQQSITGEG